MRNGLALPAAQDDRSATLQAANLELLRRMRFGTAFTAGGNERHLHGSQRLMRTGGPHHFINQDGEGLYAFTLNLATVRDVVAP
ncbi:hypothetical protein [Curtobacterium sp. MCBD17_040]|uniref:hypothetical protein n=1 Tax=Curtobacterium sp. MCBD17_040 TaxID=2175674 RepID=UPI000DA8BE64|nr:hypothetical protein [Curtobacterium sp. MCBD17_040]WIB65825.1 hypothetical protein DEI94_17065 [Curtobacterium sp. MCBD17_040]